MSVPNVLLILNTSSRGELRMYECTKYAVMLILNTSNREDLSMLGGAQCTVDPGHK
jgi:hypothetical protein